MSLKTFLIPSTSQQSCSFSSQGTSFTEELGRIRNQKPNEIEQMKTESDPPIGKDCSVVVVSDNYQD